MLSEVSAESGQTNRPSRRDRAFSVLLVTSSYPPVLGGSEIEAQRVSSALIAKGHKVKVLCQGHDCMPFHREWLDPAGVPVRIVGRRWPRRLRDYLFALEVAAHILARRREYDVVYFLMQGLHLATGLAACRAAGKPVLMKISGSGIIGLMEQVRLGRLELQWLRKWAWRVMILNDGIAEEAVKAGLDRKQLVWMPNPVDTLEFVPVDPEAKRKLREQLGIGRGSPVVIYTGRLAPEKELPSLVEAMRMVAEKLPDALLVLVGDGPDRQALEGAVRELGMQRNVRFCGRQSMPEVIRWLQSADIFALVSSNEGLPCSLLEAMSVALPSVVSGIPANRQLVEPGIHGLSAAVGDSKALAAALLDLSRDEKARERMGMAARRLVIEKFSIDRVLEQYETLFASALNGSRQ